ncbi:MAG: SDR family oxidoreductase [Chitinivibrionales bacterium]
MKELIVTGASGFLGWNLCNAANNEWQVTGICNTHEIPGSLAPMRAFDLYDFPAVDRLFKNLRPDAIVHAAAATDPNFCQLHPDQAGRINIEASEHIAGLCGEYGAACVFISTDLVFDGKNPPYSEMSPLNPLSVYGEQKVEAEKRMTDANKDVLICRMPLMFGDAPSHSRNHFKSLIDNIIKGNEVPLFIDEFRSVVSGYDAAKGILRFLGTRRGVIHLGGKKPVSRCDFGMAVAAALGVDSPRLRPCLQKDIAMPAPRPANVSLDSSEAFSHGYDPDSLEVALGNLECIRKGKANLNPPFGHPSPYQGEGLGMR